ncbi:MAG: hypothetical protein GX444_15490 [Myxococcales bacterium]|nr:hypothetical protein [Myxococcales bacterium]
MNNRLMICFLFLLLGAFFTVSCDHSSDNDDDDNNDSGTDDDAFVYPPVCTEPYVENAAWLDPEYFYFQAEEFDELYGRTFVPATVTPDGEKIIFATADWQLSFKWKTDRPHPFTDQMEVLLFAGSQPLHDWADTHEPLLWVLDPAGDLLLYHDPNLIAEPIDSRPLSFTFEEQCRYSSGQQPPTGPGVNWLYVDAMSLTGQVGEVSFSASPGGEPTISDDGLYDVYLPVSYYGKNDADCDDCSNYVRRALLEIVRRPAD